MPVDETPAVTGPLGFPDNDKDTIADWLGVRGTGDEYGGVFVETKLRLARLWGLDVHTIAQSEQEALSADDGSLQSRAAAIARNVPAVEVVRPTVPELSGDLLTDVRAVTGLTLDEIARANHISGRAVAGWRAGTVPRHRQPFLQSLRSIGLSLVGGLGTAGVQRWFLAGRPSRLDRLAAGDVDGVVGEARAYRTSPAT